MSSSFCFRNPDYIQHLFNELQQFRSHELFVDATLICGEQQYQAHRLILSSCSEYFKEIFENSQCCHPIIILNDVENENLEALLTYMYEGTVVVSNERMGSLLRDGQILRIKGMISSYQHFSQVKCEYFLPNEAGNFEFPNLLEINSIQNSFSGFSDKSESYRNYGELPLFVKIEEGEGILHNFPNHFKENSSLSKDASLEEQNMQDLLSCSVKLNPKVIIEKLSRKQIEKLKIKLKRERKIQSKVLDDKIQKSPEVRMAVTDLELSDLITNLNSLDPTQKNEVLEFLDLIGTDDTGSDTEEICQEAACKESDSISLLKAETIDLFDWERTESKSLVVIDPQASEVPSVSLERMHEHPRKEVPVPPIEEDNSLKSGSSNNMVSYSGTEAKIISRTSKPVHKRKRKRSSKFKLVMRKKSRMGVSKYKNMVKMNNCLGFPPFKVPKQKFSSNGDRNVGSKFINGIKFPDKNNEYSGLNIANTEFVPKHSLKKEITSHFKKVSQHASPADCFANKVAKQSDKNLFSKVLPDQFQVKAKQANKKAFSSALSGQFQCKPNRHAAVIKCRQWSLAEKKEIYWCGTYARHHSFPRKEISLRTRQMLLERGFVDKKKVDKTSNIKLIGMYNLIHLGRTKINLSARRKIEREVENFIIKDDANLHSQSDKTEKYQWTLEKNLFIMESYYIGEVIMNRSSNKSQLLAESLKGLNANDFMALRTQTQFPIARLERHSIIAQKNNIIKLVRTKSPSQKRKANQTIPCHEDLVKRKEAARIKAKEIEVSHSLIEMMKNTRNRLSTQASTPQTLLPEMVVEAVIESAGHQDSSAAPEESDKQHVSDGSCMNHLEENTQNMQLTDESQNIASDKLNNTHIILHSFL